MDIPELDHFALSLEAGVARIAFDRPAHANALDAPMWTAMRSAFEWADRYDPVRWWCLPPTANTSAPE